MIRKIRKMLANLLGAASFDGGSLRSEVDRIRIENDYMLLELSRMRSLVRHLVAPVIHELPITTETKESFAFQWSDCPDGDWTVTRPELKEREPKLVCQYTGLDPEWFQNKRVLDAGCGSGRFTYAMASMGASVVSVDQSESGVFYTKKACESFGDKVEVHRHDLTKPLDLEANFDLVWSYGVLHHTGDTFGAFENVSRLVKSHGLLFLMLYGEPEGKDLGEYVYYSEVERLRRATCMLNFQERYELIEKLKGEEVGGWFDAVSPRINDTYPLYEIELWFLQAGFVDFKRTVGHSNHFVIGRKL